MNRLINENKINLIAYQNLYLDHQIFRQVFARQNPLVHNIMHN